MSTNKSLQELRLEGEESDIVTQYIQDKYKVSRNKDLKPDFTAHKIHCTFLTMTVYFQWIIQYFHLCIVSTNSTWYEKAWPLQTVIQSLQFPTESNITSSLFCFSGDFAIYSVNSLKAWTPKATRTIKCWMLHATYIGSKWQKISMFHTMCEI